MNKSLLLCVLVCVGCADLTAPQIDQQKGQPAQVRAATAVRAPAAAPAPAPAPAPPAAAETVGASHILVAYKGAQRAQPKVTRSKDEAKAEAARLAKLAQKPGADFAALAKEHTDDPSGTTSGGTLGEFTRDRMVKPFADAAFAMKPGEISDPVETAFGFHIIKRTK